MKIGMKMKRKKGEEIEIEDNIDSFHFVYYLISLRVYGLPT
jgi:hypothetical protein